MGHYGRSPGGDMIAGLPACSAADGAHPPGRRLSVRAGLVVHRDCRQTNFLASVMNSAWAASAFCAGAGHCLRDPAFQAGKKRPELENGVNDDADFDRFIGCGVVVAVVVWFLSQQESGGEGLPRGASAEHFLRRSKPSGCDPRTAGWHLPGGNLPPEAGRFTRHRPHRDMTLVYGPVITSTLGEAVEIANQRMGRNIRNISNRQINPSLLEKQP